MKEFFFIFGSLSILLIVTLITVTIMTYIGNYLETKFGTIAAFVGPLLFLIFIVSIIGAIVIRLIGERF